MIARIQAIGGAVQSGGGVHHTRPKHLFPEGFEGRTVSGVVPIDVQVIRVDRGDDAAGRLHAQEAAVEFIGFSHAEAAVAFQIIAVQSVHHSSEEGCRLGATAVK